MKNKFFVWIGLLFLIILMSRGCQGSKTNNESLSKGDLALLTTNESYNRGKDVILQLQNNTGSPIVIPSPCGTPPVDIFFYENGDYKKLEASLKINCTNQPKELNLLPQKKFTLSLSSWKHFLFSELGRYQFRITVNGKTYSSNDFTIAKETFLQLFWTNLFYQPIYNVLIFFTKIIPWHGLGLAIIMLTVLIRLILLAPSQKAMRSQKKLQEIQPKLQAIQKKHQGQQDKIAMETMKLWKEHKVNPLSSCLPLIIQLPIMIALYYVVRDGINPDNLYLLYSPLKNFSLDTINTNFLGILELTKVNALVLPFIVGALQFVQMKMTLPKALAAQKNQDKKKTSALPEDQMQMMNKTFTYFMPIMIAIFTASVPAGVGLYWGVSTLFGIGQQLVINREKDKNKPQVEVIS